MDILWITHTSLRFNLQAPCSPLPRPVELVWHFRRGRPGDGIGAGEIRSR